MKLLALSFLFLNLIVKVLAVNESKNGKIRLTFDEIFGKGWNEDELNEIKVEETPLNSNLWAWNLTKKKRTERTEIQTVQTLTEQAEDDKNIDQKVEAYNSDSTDQNLTQEYPDYIDQGEDEDETIEGFIGENHQFKEKEKREIISKFHAIREEYKQQGKVTGKERNKIERKIGRKLGVNRTTIFKWKKEFGLSRKMKINKKPFYEKKKREFIDRMDEIKMLKYGEQNKLLKDLGISKETLYRWKKEFGLPINSQIYSDSEKWEIMKTYYKIKGRDAKISDLAIANFLNIGTATLKRWKKQFVNSGDGHSFPENVSA